MLIDPGTDRIGHLGHSNSTAPAANMGPLDVDRPKVKHPWADRFVSVGLFGMNDDKSADIICPDVIY